MAATRRAYGSRAQNSAYRPPWLTISLVFRFLQSSPITPCRQAGSVNRHSRGERKTKKD